MKSVFAQLNLYIQQDGMLVPVVPSSLCVLFCSTDVQDANSFMQGGAQANVGTHSPGI